MFPREKDLLTACSPAFDINQKSFDFSFHVAFLVVVALISTFAWLARRNRWFQWGTAYALAVTGLILFVVSLTGSVIEYKQLHHAYNSGRYSLVEGLVDNFSPMPFEGHQAECFAVNGVRFCYSDYDRTAGFNQTSSHGGPIRQGVRVRIAYLGNHILRLELCPSRKDAANPIRKPAYATESLSP